MALRADLAGLYALTGLDDPRAKWFVNLSSPDSAGIKIDPWGEADDLVVSFGDWGKPTGVTVGTDRITGTWSGGRAIYLDSRSEHPEENIPEVFPGLKITLHVPSNRVPQASADGKIRFKFPVVGGWGLFDFHLQPELTPEEITEGSSRPIHVIDSIAVYHKTKGILNPVEFANRKTGKVCHIYRPFVRDSTGKFSWGSWEVDTATQTLVKAFPASVFSGAQWYDVDADMGWSSIGASTLNGGANNVFGFGPWAGADGTLDSVTVYIAAQTAGTSATFGVYVDSSGTPTTLIAYSDGAEISTSWGWRTQNLGGEVISAGNSYHIAKNNNTGYGYLRYDSGTAYNIKYKASTYSAGSLVNPFPSSPTVLTGYRASAYATYTPTSSSQDRKDSITKGVINLSGYSLKHFRQYTLSSSIGTVRLVGLDPSIVEEQGANQNVKQSIDIGVLNLNGQSILRNVQSGGIVGRLLLNGLSPDFVTTGVQNKVSSIAPGTVYLNGLDPNYTTHFVDVYVDVVAGTLNVSGLTIAEQRQVLSMGKSAASRLGLYSTVDIWTTPLTTVGKQFKKEQKQVVEIIQEGENLQRSLEKVVEELSQEYQALKTKATKLELQTAAQRSRRLQKQIEQLRYKLLLDEDEELLILLL